MVGPIGTLLGASEVIASQMEVAEGRYTGEMVFWAYGEAKASRVRELASRRGYRLPDCYAYSDSVTDLPMLEVVGYPRVVNPDRALRKIAAARHWPVLTFGTRSPADRGGRPGPPEPAGTEVSPVGHIAGVPVLPGSRARDM